MKFVVCLEGVAVVRGQTLVEATSIEEAIKIAKERESTIMWATVGPVLDIEANKVVDYDTDRIVYRDERG